MVQCLETWGWAIELSHTVVYSDHQALAWFWSKANMSSGRLTRWAWRMMRFDFEIRYRRGVENVAPDALSMVPLAPRVATI